MRENLSQMTELVKQNLLEAQRKQKPWYDIHARSREFRDGDLVLVLWPSSSNKLCPVAGALSRPAAVWSAESNYRERGQKDAWTGVQIFLSETKAGGGTTTWKTADWYTVSAEYLMHIGMQYNASLKEMLRNDIHLTCEWAAPVVLAKKRDGSLRICVDYRWINEVAQMDSYPIHVPHVDEIIDQLEGYKFTTTLDLAWGYWQVPVVHEHRKKTAFVTSYLYEFKLMPFELKGAPTTFQRIMDQIHLEHLWVVLGRLQQAGLWIKLSKCQFGMDHLVYLGHVVGKGVVIPELSKLIAVEASAVPETKTEVRAFLGVTGYYRRFIAKYSEIASPVTDVVKKSAPSKTDALDRAVGAVLSQVNEIGEEHPVGYFSRKLLP
ncbi:hypothetical protein EMCRGX_G006429 [Ephydatia muelleri]